MKKYIIIGLIVLVGGALLIMPLLKGGSDDEKPAAEFAFDEYLAVPYGKELPIAISVNSEDIKKIELYYNDSLFTEWVKPTKNVNFLLKADIFGLGAKSLTLKTYMNDGSRLEDPRLVRVLSDISPDPMKAVVLESYPHDVSSYTQGLEFNDGQLYEGTGNPQNGAAASIVGKIDLKTGKIGMKNGLDATYFGEGITVLGDKLYQLTWKSGKCFVYDKNNLELKLKDFTYQGEGWGLCNDGKYLIMSDGSERIVFRNPETFDVVKTIEVYTNQGPVIALNELEYIDGKIYANIYTSTEVVVIEPETGRVLQVIDASALESAGKMGGEVLNGIAYNPADRKIYMTGKYWGKLLKVDIVPF